MLHPGLSRLRRKSRFSLLEHRRLPFPGGPAKFGPPFLFPSRNSYNANKKLLFAPTSIAVDFVLPRSSYKWSGDFQPLTRRTFQ